MRVTEREERERVNERRKGEGNRERGKERVSGQEGGRDENYKLV